MAAKLPVDVRHPELMLRPVAELQATLRENAKATVVAGCGGGGSLMPPVWPSQAGSASNVRAIWLIWISSVPA